MFYIDNQLDLLQKAKKWYGTSMEYSSALLPTKMPADATEPLVYNIHALNTHSTPMAPPLRKLVNYIQDNWVHTTKWPTLNWSVYNRSIRTNNNCEGWHRIVNSRVRCHHLPFYQLVEFLHQEATLVTLQTQLVADDKLKWDQRSCLKKQQGKIFDLWDRYQAKELDVNNLFREISKVHRLPTKLKNQIFLH